MVDKADATMNDSPVAKKNPKTQFSANILKQVIGPEKAMNAFNSISMGSIPTNDNGKKPNLSVECKYQDKITKKHTFTSALFLVW